MSAAKKVAPLGLKEVRRRLCEILRDTDARISEVWWAAEANPRIRRHPDLVHWFNEIDFEFHDVRDAVEEPGWEERYEAMGEKAS